MTHLDKRLRIDAAPQRARGKLVLRVKSEHGQTRLQDVRQEGSFRLLFPRQHNTTIEAVTLNTAGGITGGDHFKLSADATAGSRLTLTTQAAERIYRTDRLEAGRFDTDLTVGENARMQWLPQETILFDGSAFTRSLMVNLAPTARFLMCEPIVFGRVLSAEILEDAAFSDRVQIMRDGKTIYRDSINLKGDINTQLQRPAIANGAAAMASVVFCAPEAAQRLDAVRALLPASAGVSLLADDLLCARLLAADSFVLRQSLCPLLTFLTYDALPKTWRL